MVVLSAVDDTERALRRRVALEQTIARMSRELVVANGEALDEAIESALAQLGRFVEADRAYVFLFHPDGLHIYNSHEWCAQDIAPQKTALQWLEFSDDTLFSRTLRAGQMLDIPVVAELPADAVLDREVLQAQGIVSLLVAPMWLGKELMGFMGFDAVRQLRRWSAEDHSLLELAVEGVRNSIARRRTEVALQLSEQRLRDLFNSTPKIAVQGYDEERRVFFWNNASEALYGYSAAEAMGRRLEELIIPSDMAEVVIQAHADWLHLGQPIPAGELVLRQKDGSPVEVFSSHLLQRNPQGVAEMYCVDIDLRELRQAQVALQLMATHDPLTGLPNRNLLRDRLDRALARARRESQVVAVVYIDLDHFKTLNDEHGHPVGDELLRRLAVQMRAVLREVDTLARLGGDEFVAVLVDQSSEAMVMPTLERLQAAVTAPVLLDGRVFRMSASMGVSFGGNDEAQDADLLLRQADLAMYQAKLAGKNRYALFDAELDRWVRQRHERSQRVARALRDNEFCLHYQPQVSLEQGAVMGVEALLRWQHPERGLLPPSECLPYVDKLELVLALGDWVLRTALQQLQQWHRAGLGLKVSVNIAGGHFQHPSFVGRLTDVLQEFPDIPRSRVVLELLESSSLDSLDEVAKVIAACQALGVGVAIDDFGTGYSSLAYLKALPADVLKIDRSFVRDMLVDAGDRAILSGILHLGQAFGRTVIAEGVETEAQGLALLQMGCAYAQGFGISVPLPAEDIPAWMAGWQPPSSWARAAGLAQTDQRADKRNSAEGEVG